MDGLTCLPWGGSGGGGWPQGGLEVCLVLDELRSVRRCVLGELVYGTW